MVQNTAIKSFRDVTSLFEHGVRGGVCDVKFIYSYNGEEYNVYDVIIGDSEISLYSEQGTLSFVIDKYPHGFTYELFDIYED